MSARIFVATALVAGAFVTSSLPSHANDTAAGAIIGGITGAAIGGAVTGRAGGVAAGAAIGAATGAVIGSQSGKSKSYYYWNGGRCYYRYPNGNVARVSRNYCY